MYQSLLKHCPDFHLYVFAFDADCYNYLNTEKYTNLTVVSLAEFENEELLHCKADRSAAEYCWTCSASTIYYCLKNFKLPNCTYIDADMLFYSNPGILIDEMGMNSVLITAHRYTADYDQSASSGKYCVQFVCFKNTPEGMTVLEWWKDACIKWCYARIEDGKFGDQKYLDEFSTRFTGVHELKHLGGGIAPWNVQQYSFETQNGELIGTEKQSGTKFKAVFYHFHGLKFFDSNIVSLTDKQYAISKEIQDVFYFPYLKLLHFWNQGGKQTKINFNPHGSAGKSPYQPLGLKQIFQFYLEGISISRRNSLGFNLLNRIAHHYYFKNKAD
jgi:hypothetical protein